MQIGIIGRGRVGSALLRNLEGSLSLNSCKDEKNLVESCDVIFLTVPDRAIKKMAVFLSQGDLKGKIFFHCSGSLGLEPLISLEQCGGQIGSMHPLQSFGSPAVDFSGVYIALAGSEKVKIIGEKIASLLGAKVFTVPENERKLYHAAACFASNYVVTLIAIAQTIMSRWTHDEKAALEALLPLLTGTVHNLHQVSWAATALTGPIARGDTATVAGHLEVLPEKYKATYKTLGKITVNLAEKNKEITNRQACMLRDLL